MTDTANANDIIMKGLSNETEGLGRFGHHPDPAIDFCIEVETLESRLHQAEHGLSRPGSVPETIAAVLHDIQKALNFRVGGDEGAVLAKHLLRSLEDKAKSLILTDTANAPERIWAWPHGETDWTDIISAFFKNPTWISKKRGVAEYVLAAHCDELVAAAYLDATQVLEDEIDLARIALPQAVPVLRADIRAIKNRTPTKAKVALTARDERMKAEGAREAQAKIARLTEALTPSGDTKAAYMSEFEFIVFGMNDDGEECSHKITVPWTAIKEIMAAIKARAALQENAHG